MTSPQTLVKTDQAKELFLYLAILEFAVNAVLAKDKNRAPKPVCYISIVLLDMEFWYPILERLP